MGNKFVGGFFMLMGLVGVAMAFAGAAIFLEPELDKMGWPSVSGSVTSTKVETDRVSGSSSSGGSRSHGSTSDTVYVPQATFRYEVDGTAYESEPLRIGFMTYRSKQRARSALGDGGYTQGAEFEVFYDPDDPATATITRGLWFVAGLVLASLVMGVAAGALGLMFWRRPAPEECTTGTLGPFAPSVFDDPIAAQLDWDDPDATTASSFRMFEVVAVGPERLEVRVRTAPRVCGWMFGLVGVALLAVSVGAVVRGFLQSALVGHLVVAGVSFVAGGILSVVGLIFVLMGMKTTVLDAACGFVWKGRRSREPSPEDRDRARRVADVRAVQILDERHESSTQSTRTGARRQRTWTSFPLSLVFGDGTRQLVHNQTDLAGARRDAKTIGTVIGCAVWDRTMYE